MNWSIRGADAGTHLRIVATALVAATVVLWVGIAARVSPAPPANWRDAPARPATMPVGFPTVPVQVSMITMIKTNALDGDQTEGNRGGLYSSR
jgi:hypothetical protein